MATATPTYTDEQIQHEVLDELKWDARVRPNEIGVVVKDGIVTLTAWVETVGTRSGLHKAAHRVHGVKAVANDIEVRSPTLPSAPMPISPPPPPGRWNGTPSCPSRSSM